MKRSRSDNRRLGPAAAAMRRRDIFRDGREAKEQVSVGKLFSDAVEMQQFHSNNQSGRGTRVLIHTREELALYRQKRRAELEEGVRRGYKAIGNWTRYARWEAQQRDFPRMRSVLERAMDVHSANFTLWRDYAELEQVNGFVTEARVVWQRAEKTLPGCVDIWLKHLVMEQAAGEAIKVRDVFSRWLAIETPPPCAFELLALYEAQQEQQDACRDALRRYVERYNVPTSWLLYSATEGTVFGDLTRCIKVLQTALRALPEEMLWGPEECRVPLALAEALAAHSDREKEGVQRARDAYTEVLQKVQSYPALLDEALAAYSRFERMHGDGAHFRQVARLRSMQLYEARLQQHPDDMDDCLSLYLLYREQEEEAGEKQHGQAEASPTASPSLQLLQRALQAKPTDAYGAQQHAVLTMEYARRCEEAGCKADGQAALAREIKHFPFEAASCPRLWVEAAGLEGRHGEEEQARKLLRAGAQVTRDPLLFEGAIGLEEQLLAHLDRAPAESDPALRQVLLTNLRAAYQTAIKSFTTEVQWWMRFAKLEEREGQPTRADAIYNACITTLGREAAQALSSGGGGFRRRYDLLRMVDVAWGRRIAYAARCLRQAQRKAGKGAAPPAEMEDARSKLLQLYGALLHDVWVAYRVEALQWYDRYMKKEGRGGGVLASSAPASLPESLSPATSRWAEAVEAVAGYLEKMQGLPSANFKETLREMLKSLLASEREQLRGAVGWTEETTSFDATQHAYQWSELLLTPLRDAWVRFEVTHGGDLSAVQEVTSEPVRRRTRLFKKK